MFNENDFKSISEGPCPICRNKWTIYSDKKVPEFIHYVKCFRCGEFSVSTTYFEYITPKLTDDQSAIFSSWIYNNQGTHIDKELGEQLKNKRPASVGERAENLLVYISRNITTKLGEEFSRTDLKYCLELPISAEENKILGEDYNEIVKYSHMLSVSESRHYGDLYVLINNYLCEYKEYLDNPKDNYRITALGWDHVYSIQSSPSSDKCFIAMEYDKEKKITGFFESLIGSIENDTGYQVVIMKDHSHSNIIEDEMKKEILGSKFVIADLTNNNRGAYYEAGYAHGLGKPVIFTINKTYLDEVKNDLKKKEQAIHFDTNHYPYKTWDYNPKERDQFVKWLINRIQADERIGKGSYSKN